MQKRKKLSASTYMYPVAPARSKQYSVIVVCERLRTVTKPVACDERRCYDTIARNFGYKAMALNSNWISTRWHTVVVFYLSVTLSLPVRDPAVLGRCRDRSMLQYY